LPTGPEPRSGLAGSLDYRLNIRTFKSPQSNFSFGSWMISLDFELSVRVASSA